MAYGLRLRQYAGALEISEGQLGVFEMAPAGGSAPTIPRIRTHSQFLHFYEPLPLLRNPVRASRRYSGLRFRGRRGPLDPAARLRVTVFFGFGGGGFGSKIVG